MDDGPGQQAIVSRWAAASAAALPIAGGIYLFGYLEGKRMVAAGQGWEMAFCWSPPVFLAIDVVLALGGVAGLVGLVIGPGARWRVQAAAAALVCVGSFLLLPWR